MATPMKNENGAGNWSTKNFGLGVDNLSPETALPRGALRYALNVDFDRTGRWSRRRGTQVIIPGEGMHSLWAPKLGEYAYFVQGSNLCRCTPGTPSAPPVILRADITPEVPMVFCDLTTDIMFSNGFQFGSLFGTIGVEMPNGVLEFEPGPGALAPGTYRIAMVFVGVNGEESGAVSSTFTLEAQGGISLVHCPVPKSPGVTARFFLSPTDDPSVMYQAIDMDFTEAEINFTVPGAGRLLETEFMEPPPAPRIMAASNGRLMGAIGPMIWYTQPFRYGLYKPSTDYMLFESDVTMIASSPDNNGWYIGTQDGLFFLSGNQPDETKVNQVSELSPIEGSMTVIDTVVFPVKGMPEVLAPVWFTERGWVVGLDEGVINNLVHDKLALANLGRGSSFVRKENGSTHLVGVFRGGDGPSVAAASDSMTSEIIRNGIVIDT